MTLKVGVIGVGEMGRHHARVYSEMGNVELIGVTDIDKNVSKEIAKKYNTEAFTDYKKFLSEDIDAVSIAVPTKLHKEIAIHAMNNGVNVLIEKPIADSLNAADEIINTAIKNDVKLMVGHIERFNPAILTFLSLIHI